MYGDNICMLYLSRMVLITMQTGITGEYNEESSGMHPKTVYK